EGDAVVEHLDADDLAPDLGSDRLAEGHPDADHREVEAAFAAAGERRAVVETRTHRPVDPDAVLDEVPELRSERSSRWGREDGEEGTRRDVARVDERGDELEGRRPLAGDRGRRTETTATRRADLGCGRA